MATVTTSWATYATENLTWYDSYSGQNWGVTIQTQAKYVKKNDTTVTINVREVVSLNPPSGYVEWYGSNKYYNVNNNGRVQDTATLNAGSPHQWDGASFDVSAGNSFSISAYYEVMGNSKTASASITAPTFVVAPNKPTISASNINAVSNSISYGTTSFGTPSTGTVYLYGGTSNNPTTQIASKTTTGTSTFTHSSLSPNMTYYYRARAYNGSAYSDYSNVVTVKTPSANPATPTISVAVVNAHSIKITFGTTSFGYPNSGTVYLYGGTSSTPTTQITSKTTTGNSTYTYSNLSGNTQYYFRARAYNGTYWSDYSVTVNITTPFALYVPTSSNKAILTRQIYASQGGLARPIKKLYDSSSGKARRIY